MASLPSSTLRRAHLPSSPSQFTQCRHASLLKRPHRPYTFTQLVTLSDGSTYTQRTTSPQPVYRSSKDTRNHFLWQPSLESLRNVEQDEAGRLRAFRSRFGRTFDLETSVETPAATADAPKEGEDAAAAAASTTTDAEAKVRGGEEEEESLMDLISGGVYSKSYNDTKEAMKNDALNKGKKGGKKGK